MSRFESDDDAFARNRSERRAKRRQREAIIAKWPTFESWMRSQLWFRYTSNLSAPDNQRDLVVHVRIPVLFIDQCQKGRVAVAVEGSPYRMIVTHRRIESWRLMMSNRLRSGTHRTPRMESVPCLLTLPRP